MHSLAYMRCRAGVRPDPVHSVPQTDGRVKEGRKWKGMGQRIMVGAYLQRCAPKPPLRNPIPVR